MYPGANIVEKLEKIEVIAYSGYKAEESPRAFCLQGTWITVVKIQGQWIEEEVHGTGRYRCYRVKGSDWKSYLICYNEGKKEWFCRTRQR